MKCRWICLVSLLSFAASAQAVELCGNLSQGEILRGHTNEYSVLHLNGKDFRISPQGDFLIAFGRDDGKNQKIVFKSEDGTAEKLKLALKPTQWDIQNLTGVPQRKVTPSKQDEKAILEERSKIRTALAQDKPQPYWQRGFIKPVEGRTSGNFGGQRIMNGNKMNPHAGMDIAVPEGTAVKASGDGVVTLTANNLFYSGNVVVVDHGFGLQTIYAHLSQIGVKEGQQVKQGDVIAQSGKTGRVTGPHLHWGASLNGVKFNPVSLLQLKNNDFCFNL